MMNPYPSIYPFNIHIQIFTHPIPSYPPPFLLSSILYTISPPLFISFRLFSTTTTSSSSSSFATPQIHLPIVSNSNSNLNPNPFLTHTYQLNHTSPPPTSSTQDPEPKPKTQITPHITYHISHLPSHPTKLQPSPFRLSFSLSPIFFPPPTLPPSQSKHLHIYTSKILLSQLPLLTPSPHSLSSFPPPTHSPKPLMQINHQSALNT